MQLDPRGSRWRRWDPHIHAPGTILNDQFGGPHTLDDYLNRIETAVPTLEAVGVTDYLTTGGYEAVLEASRQGRVANLALLFPNVEMRLSIETRRSRGVNLHLLVSPDDPDHVAQLQRFLSRLDFDYKGDKYSCTRDELMRLGVAHSPGTTDPDAALRVGVNQFKVDFRQLRQEYDKSDWMKANSLVAVAGGTTDGTAGLQSEDASFAATRREIERFAHIIFSSSEQQAKFWRGDGSSSVGAIVREYGSLKPCLHGSDAHCLEDVGAPDLDRYTWLKGDATFETLRQACIEPGSRVSVGAAAPDSASQERTISRVTTEGAAWLLDSGLDINPGLVAVIGARGSGKTALADLIAHGAASNGPLDTPDSFLTRARPFLVNATVAVEWSTGDETGAGLAQRHEDIDAEVHYLSQQFVENLCSAEGTSDALVAEIEKVVFAAHPPTTRMESTSFEQLLDAHVGDTRRQREHLRARMDRLSEDVLAEWERKQHLPTKQRLLTQMRAALEQDQKLRAAIVNRGEQERAAYYDRLQVAISARERAIQAGAKRLQRLNHLTDAISRFRDSVFPAHKRDLESEFQDLAFTAPQWESFVIDFDGRPEEVVTDEKNRVAAAVDSMEQGDPAVTVSIAATPDELAMASLKELRASFEKVGAEIGVDRVNATKLKALNDRIANRQLEVDKAEREIELFEGAPERLTSLVEVRAEAYADYFQHVVAEEATLGALYRPLEAQLRDATETVGKLRLVVVRHVDLDGWAYRGEQLLDLRKSGKFKGRGALAAFAREELLPAWESGDAAAVSGAMARFRAEYDAAIVAQSSVDRETDPHGYHEWSLEVGRWLYSTDHIDVRYSFEFEGVPLAQLSPGTRGIVLLLLYLALDVDDFRPLIIDQPEENLDPRSVFAELVKLFRAARARRQVIIVTHNANLVVNTDVDQVIVATSTRQGEGQPPLFTYRSGSLENGAIRTDVCEILEGGEAAFRDRARRLRLSGF